MRLALSLALRGEGRTGANPIVGSVIIDATGTVLAEGFHAGGDHAEVVAIKNAKKIPAGATIVVTLEPCNHTGKTGPCTQAIIDAGISRVVFATSDPNPIASGGADRLRTAGIEVVDGVMGEEARFFNRAWLSVIEKQRPLYIWKVATTLDGRIAASDGTSKWITSEAAREYVTLLRRKSDAILVGTGTVIADNPELLPHDDEDSKNPLRVVMGLREIPAESNVLDDRALLLKITTHDFEELHRELLERGVKQVLVEAGSELGSAMLSAGIIDEILLFQAPTILGAGPSFVSDLGITTLSDRIDLKVLAHRQIGNDLVTHLAMGR
jgi:diaminohydroxyphosphoribosylaminopyrimidine deaminase/5-amino-6-(5-phosphoribosylamino)uracil reductase